MLEWKTTRARYSEQPEGLTSLDFQLVCRSWITGLSEVAIVGFVRKRVPEIQYLAASIYRRARGFGQLVETTEGRIETAQFLPRPRIPLQPLEAVQDPGNLVTMTIFSTIRVYDDEFLKVRREMFPDGEIPSSISIG